MANLSLTTQATSDNQISVVESFEQIDLPATETVVAGAPVRIDSSAGTLRNGNGTTNDEADIYGLAINGATIRMGITALRRGIVDGFDLSALDYWSPIYVSDTDGRIADTPGTLNKAIGWVIPATAVPLGTAYDKLLLVDVPGADKGLLTFDFQLKPFATVTEYDLMVVMEPFEVLAASVVPSTLQGGALTATLVKATGTDAPVKTTTPLHTADAINLNTGAYTVQNLTLTATLADRKFAKGDRLGIDFSAAFTTGHAAASVKARRL